MKTESSKAPPASRRIARAEAAAWIVRLHGPHRSPEVEAGFRVWLAASPENAREFERVTDVWDAASTIPTAGLPRISRSRESRRPQRWALAAMILLAFGLGAWGLNHFWLTPSYATGVGEQRLVPLPDGSRIALNSNTRLRVNCCDKHRRVHLERGEAYFEVARDPVRPFVVVAGDHQVTALGTAFVVRHEASRTAVTLVEGSVVVSGSAAGEAATTTPTRQQSSPDESGSGPRLVLSPGQRLTFSGRAAPRLDEPRIEAVTAWRRGEVMLDSTTLADAVAEMNRYDERKLVIDEPGVAGLRVSGIYHAGDSEGFAKTIANLYGLYVVHEARRIHLRSTPPPHLVTER